MNIVASSLINNEPECNVTRSKSLLTFRVLFYLPSAHVINIMPVLGAHKSSPYTWTNACTCVKVNADQGWGRGVGQRDTRVVSIGVADSGVPQQRNCRTKGSASRFSGLLNLSNLSCRRGFSLRSRYCANADRERTCALGLRRKPL